MQWWIVVAAVFFAAVWLWVESRIVARQMRPYDRRSCAGIHWHRAFPKVPHDRVRPFLRQIVDCFERRKTHICVFRPDDRIVDVGNALSTSISVDAFFEFDSFAWRLQDDYNFDLFASGFDDITFGEVFEMLKNDSR